MIRTGYIKYTNMETMEFTVSLEEKEEDGNDSIIISFPDKVFNVYLKDIDSLELISLLEPATTIEYFVKAPELIVQYTFSNELSLDYIRAMASDEYYVNAFVEYYNKTIEALNNSYINDGILANLYLNQLMESL